jgi:hypothetical protein
MNDATAAPTAYPITEGREDERLEMPLIGHLPCFALYRR